MIEAVPDMFKEGLQLPIFAAVCARNASIHAKAEKLNGKLEPDKETIVKAVHQLV